MKIKNITEISKSKSGFSLIELSIVLIIIGLLVAGITGGASLIKSAKNRAFLNEVTSYRQAVYVFRAVNDKYPGDTDCNGLFGGCWVSPCNSDTFTTSSFPGYDTIVPSVYSAPFIDLYLSGTINFQPSKTSNAIGLGYPYSKVFKSKALYFIYLQVPNSTSNVFMHNTKRSSTFISFSNPTNKTEEKLFPKVFQFLDNKVDDGLALAGEMRGKCCNGTEADTANCVVVSVEYDVALNNNRRCDVLNLRVN